MAQSMRGVLARIQEAGYSRLHLAGNDEAAEIFRLTCLEQGVRVTSGMDGGIPSVDAAGTSFSVCWPESGGEERTAAR